MVIYAEYLFLENTLAGLVVLHLTKKLCGFHTKHIKVATGSIFCGIYAFVLFWEGLPWWGDILLKLMFSIALVAWVFSTKSRMKFLQGLLVFYLVSLAMGGIVIGSMIFFNVKGISGGGTFYIGEITYVKVISGILLTWVGVSLFANFLKQRIWKGRTDMRVTVSINNRTEELIGMMDTGNFLTDPLTGKPVFLISESAIKGFLSCSGNGFKNLYPIPYRSVGCKEGILQGIRPEKVVVREDRKKSVIVDVVLAIYKGTFPEGWGGKKYDILLHPAALEGGISEGE